MQSLAGLAMAPAIDDDAIATGAARAAPEGEALIERATFEAIYDEHFDFVWRSARRLGVPSAAVDDVVQEIFLVIARRHGDFEARSSLRTWIFGIVVGIVRNYRRSARRKDAPLVASDEAPETRSDDRPSQPGPYRLAVKAEALRLLHRLLDELDDDKREVFVMAELEQLATAEIAEAIGIKVNTVQSRLRAARQKFDEALARHRARDGWRYP